MGAGWPLVDAHWPLNWRHLSSRMGAHFSPLWPLFPPKSGQKVSAGRAKTLAAHAGRLCAHCLQPARSDWAASAR